MDTKRRRRGTGSIEQMRDGSYRARMPDRGPRLRACATYEEAERLLDAAIEEIAEGKAVLPGSETLRTWGESWLDERESEGYTSIGTDRSRWKTHVEKAHFINWPLDSIEPGDIYQWIDELRRRHAAKGRCHRRTPKRQLGRTTMQNTLNLLRCCLGDARDRGKMKVNPCAGVRLSRRREAVTHDPWTYLRPDEQQKLLTCAAIPEADRLLIAFAMGTGLRESEQWNLHLADVSADRKSITVRYGSDPGRHRNRRNARAKAGPTKGGKPRTVPIFGLGREALLRWLEILPKRSNKFRLVWPSPEGCRRQPKEPALWKKWLKAAGIIADKREDQMPVRWHDLRHTCAASLVSGWWGRRWSIEEIKELLGHQDITTTQRYAHLHEQALQTAAQEADRTRNRALKRVREDDRPASLVIPP